MEQMDLNKIANGQLAQQFQESFEKVMQNLLDYNCSPKDKRKITIELTFSENEQRDKLKLDIKVKEKLAPVYPAETVVYMGKDLVTGEILYEESGNGLRGQMTLSDYAAQQVVDGKVVDTDTGEVIEANNKIVRYKELPV